MFAHRFTLPMIPFRRRIVSILACSVVFAVSGVAAPSTSKAARVYGEWTLAGIGGGGGGYHQRLVISPSEPSRYYVYIDTGGVYRSDDKGESWRIIHGHGMSDRRGNYEVRGINVDPRDADNLVVAMNHKWSQRCIYQTKDGGRTWAAVASAKINANAPHRQAGDIIARSPHDPDLLLIATHGTGVLRSEDNGATWTAAGPTVYSTDIVFDRNRPGRAWLSAQKITYQNVNYEGGFFLSEDGGKTWDKLADEAPTELVQTHAEPQLLGIFNCARVRRSLDHGRTWQDYSQGLPGDEEPKSAFKWARSQLSYTGIAAGPDFAVVCTSKARFYIRRPADEAWTLVAQKGREEGDWFRAGEGSFGDASAWVGIDPEDPEHWFFTDWYALYQSKDGGKNWRLTINGIEPTVIHELNADPADNRIVHLGMADNGYFRSIDGGDRYARPPGGYVTSNAKRIAVSPADPKRVLMTGSSTGEWKLQQIFVSEDRGENWTRSPMKGLPEMRDHVCPSIVLSPDKRGVAYATVSGPCGAGAGGVYRSVDGGLSWEWFGQGLPQGERLFAETIWSGGGNELAAGPGEALLVFAQNAKRAYRFDRFKGKWVEAGLPTGQTIALAADPHRPNTFLASVHGAGLKRSTDGGATWTQVLEGDVNHLALDPKTRGRIAIGQGDTIVYSADDGRTWIDLDPTRAIPHLPANSLVFSGSRLVIATPGTGVFWRELPRAR